MDWIYYFILLAFLAVGLWINILTLPGLWLMVLATAIFAWVTGGVHVGWTGLIVLTVLAVLAEIIEFVAGGAGAAKAGGSKRAFVGAIVGGILGAIFLSLPAPIIGTIIGIVLGTFLGAWAIEAMVKQNVGQGLRVGWGAALGRLIGIFTKLAFGVVMFLIAAFISMPPLGWLWPSWPTTTPAPAVAPLTTGPTPATTQATNPNI
jgi:uncharacterized protein YqgC (DUF456 family)